MHLGLVELRHAHVRTYTHARAQRVTKIWHTVELEHEYIRNVNVRVQTDMRVTA